jgi:hypothetical protein
MCNASADSNIPGEVRAYADSLATSLVTRVGDDWLRVSVYTCAAMFDPNQPDDSLAFLSAGVIDASLTMIVGESFLLDPLQVNNTTRRQGNLAHGASRVATRRAQVVQDDRQPIDVLAFWRTAAAGVSGTNNSVTALVQMMPNTIRAIWRCRLRALPFFLTVQLLLACLYHKWIPMLRCDNVNASGSSSTSRKPGDAAPVTSSSSSSSVLSQRNDIKATKASSREAGTSIAVRQICALFLKSCTKHCCCVRLGTCCFATSSSSTIVASSSSTATMHSMPVAIKFADDDRLLLLVCCCFDWFHCAA